MAQCHILIQFSLAFGAFYLVCSYTSMGLNCVYYPTLMKMQIHKIYLLCRKWCSAATCPSCETTPPFTVQWSGNHNFACVRDFYIWLRIQTHKMAYEMQLKNHWPHPLLNQLTLCEATMYGIPFLNLSLFKYSTVL